MQKSYKPDPEALVASFADYWSKPVDPQGSTMPSEGYGLGNVASKKFKATWLQMAMTYNGAVERNAPTFNSLGKLSQRQILENRRHWRCLGPATGSGKSEFAFFWLGHFAALAPVDGYHPGGLMICRSIEQCNDAVAKINRWALEATPGIRPPAIAYTSDCPIWLEPAKLTPYRIVVLTHEGFKAEMRRVVRQGETERWSALQTWGKGQQPRAITIIDESIASVCDNFEVNLLDLKNVDRFLTDAMRKRKELKPALGIVNAAVGVLEKLSKAYKSKRDKNLDEARVGFVYAKRDLSKLDTFATAVGSLDSLLEAFESEYPHPKQTLGNRSSAEMSAMRRAIDHLADVIRLDAYYHRKGDHDIVAAGRYILPHDLNGPCLLDATVNQNSLVALLGERRASIMPMPVKTRCYKNVTAYITRASRTGSEGLLDGGRGKTKRLVAWLTDNVASDQKCLVVCHKDVEEQFLAEAIKKAGLSSRVSVAHWFALDGKNDWADHDTVVLYGMPYRPRTIFVNLLLAMRERDDCEDYLGSDEMLDLRIAIQNKTMIADVIQAINRVRCRRTVDKLGNCLPVRVFAILPNDKTGDAIEQAIVREMPDIVLKEWNFRLTDRQAGGRKATDPRDREFIEVIKRAQKIGGSSELTSLLEEANLPTSKDYLNSIAKKASIPGTFIHNEMVRRGAWMSFTRNGNTFTRYINFD
jgi:hypothetical protein